jgi:hypothetical protein
VPDDPGVAQQSLDVGLAVASDHGRVEAGEHLPEAVPLAQDRQPGQPGLEPFEAELLEQSVVVDHGPAPLVVVVGDVVGVVARPPAAGDAVVAGHEFVAHRFLVDCTALRLGPVMGSDGTLPQPPTRRQS